MTLVWLKPRRYRHFDLPINESFARKAMSASFVAQHSFSPLIHYNKIEKHYKKCSKTGGRVIAIKERPIKYASHRDSCILSYYSYQLVQKLEDRYNASDFGESIVAYRSLGKSNYDFAAEALNFAKQNLPVMILAFDVSSFFDNLDHKILKNRLRFLLNTTDLPKDWYKIFLFITAFHFVEIKDLTAHSIFGPRLKEKSRNRIASLAELKKEGIPFRLNPEIVKGFQRGIPQGTPISASVSNLYMIDFDAAMYDICKSVGAFYRRYSDDVLIICKPSDSGMIEAEIKTLFSKEKLEISAHKTEKNLFGNATSVSASSRAAQYLGFTFDNRGAAIRESSLSRQWRKMRRAMQRARKASSLRVKTGGPAKIYTKKLYSRFSHIEIYDGLSSRALRNFSSYARRSARAFGKTEKITKQIRRFERAAQQELAALKALSSSSP